MPIASMLEADKPFMFATSSTGRPATAADLGSSSTSKPVNSNSNTMTPSNDISYSRPISQPTTTTTATTSTTTTTAAAAATNQSYTPPAPPPPSTGGNSTTTTTTTTQYYHAHERTQPQPPPPLPPASHQQHHPNMSNQNDDPYLYHHHHHHPHAAPLPFGRPPLEQEETTSAYAYQSNGNSGGNGGSGTHITSVYAHRRMQQQQQQQQQQQPHLHPPYHVHHHLPHPLSAQPVIDEHYNPSTATATTTTTTGTTTAAAATTTAGSSSTTIPPPPPPSHPSMNGSPMYYEADDPDGWLVEVGNYEADQRRNKKRKEVGGRLEKINVDFMENRERIYAEKLAVLQEEIKQVHSNTHIAYLQGLEELKYTREKRIHDARLFRAYHERIIDNQFNRERMLAEEECSAEKREMRDKLFTALEEKRRKLKEDKDNCELAYDSLLESQTPLVFKLKDDDLQNDLEGMHIDPTPFTSKKFSSNNKKK
ncbi:hypothetical protein LRAMOSA01222 [Lichtheimia ramosa]|uniref:Uncharacterized protein n=1 Tax=Lichtheimia ramosa TaxID=688394 RepID=A0A077WJL7_9FUNG|nr:hypothetical protein LRAMOSA01222 [Lichtheimia ramosa]